ncbi:hypothetical protein CSAL01_11852 [Colletotrichum salicis]|uniref:Uncharacterized protein n=1 Tax=Colletotrichum salicis TaxID=1209931 RepID=A0A135UZ08_9PEZI|nr:hypothetical protein CSAL01_11852 [Colletotrichum salicis]
MLSLAPRTDPPQPGIVNESLLLFSMINRAFRHRSQFNPRLIVTAMDAKTTTSVSRTLFDSVILELGLQCENNHGQPISAPTAAKKMSDQATNTSIGEPHFQQRGDREHRQDFATQ